LKGLQANVLIKWLDPLTFDPAPGAPHFGANNDYIAYFGDGWDATPGNPPQWNGAGDSAWMWVNHEYISNAQPTATTAPTGQHLTLAKYLRYAGQLTNNVDSNVWSAADLTAYGGHFKKQLGGSWMHIVQDPATLQWEVDRTAKAVRYDATSATQTMI